MDNIEETRRVRKERAERRAARRLKWAEAAEKKAERLRIDADAMAQAIPFGQPILVGHHSEKRDRAFRARFVSKYDQQAEALRKAKYHRDKADNILTFATRVKGDAERARQQKREEADKLIAIGSRVYDWSFGTGVVVRVNKKTYSIKFDSGGTYARDKSWVQISKTDQMDDRQK